MKWKQIGPSLWLVACGLWLVAQGRYFASCTCPWQICALASSPWAGLAACTQGKSCSCMVGLGRQLLIFFSLPRFQGPRLSITSSHLWKWGKDQNDQLCILMSFSRCVIWSSSDTSGVGPLPTIIHNTVENFSSYVTDEPPTSKSRTGIYIYLNREGRWLQLPLTLYEDIRKFSLWVFVSLFLYDKKERVSKADFSSWLYLERYLNKLEQRIKVYFI